MSRIAAKLGHANPAITGYYLISLSKIEHPYAAEIDRLMSIEH